MAAQPLTMQHVPVQAGRHLLAGRNSDAPPHVLFDAGAFGIYVDGANVVRALDALGVPAATYTRAGLSGSGPILGAPTPDAHVADMVRLLDATGQAGPVVLAGHSMAGFRLHRFATLYPERVRGLVLIDAMVPGAIPPLAVSAFATSLRPVERVLPAFCRTADAYPNAMCLSGQERADKLASVYSHAHLRATRLEVSALGGVDVRTDHGVPMILMPAGHIARGTTALARRAGATLIDMSAWGHASVLSPGPADRIAEAANSLLG